MSSAHHLITKNVPHNATTSPFVPMNGPDSQTTTRTNSSEREQTTYQHSKRRCSHCHNIIPPDEEAIRDKEEGLKNHDDPDLVEWDGSNDPEKPLNMAYWRKWMITMLTSMITFTVSFGSSVFSTTIRVTATQFQVSEVVMLLGVSLYVLGFAVGPLLFGPASEYLGRRLPLFGGFFIFAVFQIPVTVAQNLETIFLCRFLSGLFGSAPLGINSAMFADFWEPVDRGIATSIYACAVFAGPVAGPICGSYITESTLGWRWTAWITLIMSAIFGIPAFLLTPETYEPILLKWKAAKLRQQTKNWALHAKIEETPFKLETFVEKYLTKPFKMIALEPILIIITLYMSIAYALLYLTFYAYPYAFEIQRGWSPSIASLPFLGLLVGIILACGSITVYTKLYYQPRLKERKKVLAEDRLPPMIAGSFLLPVGLFWFAWTSSPEITWVPQVLAGIPIGAGILLIFMPGLAYLVDLYLVNASSAVSANSFARSLMATGFPLFAPAMYHSVGVSWATSLLGFMFIALIPAPIIFYVYGEKVRRWSRYTFEL